MLKARKIIILTSIFLLWGIMMAKLLEKQYFPYHSALLRQNYTDTLKEIKEVDTPKVIKMEIFSKFLNRKLKKIGEISNSIVLLEDGTYDINTKYTFSFPIYNNMIRKTISDFLGIKELPKKEKLTLQIDSSLHLSIDHQLKELHCYISSDLFSINCHGITEGNQLRLTLERDSQEINKTIILPKDTMLLNLISGIQENYPELTVGKKIESQYLDPITQKLVTMTSTVETKVDFSWYDDRKVPAYMVSTDTGKLKTTSWISETGEVLQYQILSFYLIRVPEDIKGSLYD